MLELNPGSVTGGAGSELPAVEQSVTSAEYNLNLTIGIDVGDTHAHGARDVVDYEVFYPAEDVPELSPGPYVPEPPNQVV